MNRPLDPGTPERFRTDRVVDVLIPTRNRPAELAVTLSGLAAQDGVPGFGVVVSDQSDGEPAYAHPAAATMVRA
ncbi:glycosyl transferase, partial [Micromonospora azadirachtae]